MTQSPGRSTLARLALVLALSLGTAVASRAQTRPSAPPAEPQAAQIDRNGVLILIRSTLLAVHHGNQTGNYTVLRDLGAPNFQTANTASRLAEIFATQRAQNLDLSGVAVLEPQLTRLPQIVQGGLMLMAGFFPSVPVQVNFELLFAPVEGRWRLFGISLNVGQSSPAAPLPPPPAPSKPEAEAPAGQRGKRPSEAKPQNAPASGGTTPSPDSPRPSGAAPPR